MRHRYECPLRWADLDLQAHVNNVVYVDVLQEARVDMLRLHRVDDEEGAHAAAGPAAPPGEGTVVVRHEIDYRAPLRVEEAASVSVEVWATEVRAASFTLGYEIFSEADGERSVHATASTVLTPFVFASERPRRLTPDERTRMEAYLEPGEPRRRPRPEPRRHDHHHPVHVRFSDVDVYGHVNNVEYLTYVQEARVAMLSDLSRAVGVERPRVVVARTEVDYLQPVLLRRRPYDVWSWVSAVGRSSYTVDSVVADGDRDLARSRVVCVSVDPDTGRPAPLGDRLRERLAPPGA